MSVLSPEESLRQMKLEDDQLEIKLVAAEPLISTPVALSFDDRGRIWVVEMSDYRPIKGDSSQTYPLGDIAILEDTDGDGVMDKRTVFLDDIALPRAISLVNKGILISSPPNLWYYEIREDRPGKKVLVDSAYTVSDNIEGQTNGLLHAMDNWIYSAGFGSGKKYRQIDGKWITEKTFLRGQWGITQDSRGRLFYNNNSQNLLGDYFPPAVTLGNKYLKRTTGFNQKIVADNNVFPLIPTPGVNRGYRESELDSTGRLIHFTAACGPLIYRGGLLGDKYMENSFVAEPAAYLIKRNILSEKDIKVEGKQAYQQEEFLASADERFRPVNLYDGPDGALYVVDMYRGVIQDDLSLTDYLKDYSLKRGLEKPINTGRIYKIVPKGKANEKITLPNGAQKLLKLLEHKNGWIRDHAQQKLIDDKKMEAVPNLRKIVSSKKGAVTRIQAIWTLEGLGVVEKEDILTLLHDRDKTLHQQALTVLISILDKETAQEYLPLFQNIILDSDQATAPYVAFLIGKLFNILPTQAIPFWDKLLARFSTNEYVVDAVISSIEGREEQFENRYKESEIFHERLTQAIKTKDHPEDQRKMEQLRKKYEAGFAIFDGFCQTCHGADGNGIDYLAPPLNGSEWVRGNKKILTSILLYGLTGPVGVKGRMYKKPTITGDMPGINDKYPDEDIAELISFIRQAWSNDADEVSLEEVQKIKEKNKDRRQSFTAEELKRIPEQ